MKNIGYFKGEICNRNGCVGIIDEKLIDGCCSCHISPPCSYCTTAKEYCPECDWDAETEQQESESANVKNFLESGQREHYENRWQKTHDKEQLFLQRYRGELPISEIDYRIQGHSSCSQKVIGFFPAGATRSQIEEKVKGTFGGRFASFNDRTFEYIAYTD